MKIRLAVPVEAEECWNIRNQAIRYGCKSSYDDAVIAAWTPEKMPESYRNAIVVNPFFVVAAPDGRLLATGYLDLSTGSIEAVFTLPQCPQHLMPRLFMRNMVSNLCRKACIPLPWRRLNCAAWKCL